MLEPACLNKIKSVYNYVKTHKIIKLSPCDKISSMKLPEAFTYNLQSLEGSVMGGGIYDTPLRAQEMVPVRGQ